MDFLVDIRKNSGTYGESFSIILSSEYNKQLLISRGFLYGFALLENNTIFSYKCDIYCNFDVEAGVIFNDTDLKIDWILTEDELILSEIDKHLTRFRESKEFYNEI